LVVGERRGVLHVFKVLFSARMCKCFRGAWLFFAPGGAAISSCTCGAAGLHGLRGPVPRQGLHTPSHWANAQWEPCRPSPLDPALPPAAEGPRARPFGIPRLRGGLPSPTPQRRNSSRGEVGGTSEFARPPARRCAMAAGGFVTVWSGEWVSSAKAACGISPTLFVGAIHESPWAGHRSL
jgi:hypothetical protein